MILITVIMFAAAIFGGITLVVKSPECLIVSRILVGLHSGEIIMTTGRRKEGNVLFNDALNTFYLRLYGVRHMVKDHSFIPSL